MLGPDDGARDGVASAKGIHPDMLLGPYAADLGLQLQEHHPAVATVNEDEVREAGSGRAAAIAVMERKPAA